MNKKLREEIKDRIWWHIYKWGGWKGLNGGFVEIKKMKLEENNGVTTATCWVKEGVQDEDGSRIYEGEYIFKFDKDLNFLRAKE